MLAVVAATIILTAAGCHHPNAHACYDYNTQTVNLNPHEITPYILTHELGHHVYFNTLTTEQRRNQAVNDPGVINEEAWADVYAACILGYGPRWLRSNGYGIRIGINRFRRICGVIRGKH
jgi:nickel-dependent lactate racemase